MSNYLQLTSMCNRVGVPVLDHPQLIYLLVELYPGKAVADIRMPLNFCLVLDHSGSMAGEKLRTVKEAVKNIIDQLQPDDTISIVSFETKVHTLVECQSAVDKVALKGWVDGIRAGGGTNMAPALRRGLDLVNKQHGPGRVSRIILLTDGEVTDKEEDSRVFADQAGQAGIPIIGLGFGKDWNEDFLFNLADCSIQAQPGSHSGMCDYIPAPSDANKIFQEVYQSMQVVAQDLTLTLRMVQGLEARRVWQVVPLIKDAGRGVIQGRAIVIPISQLEKTGNVFLIEIMLPPRPDGMVRIAQAEVTFQLTSIGAQREVVDLILQYSNDPAVYNQMVGQVMNVVEKVQAFKLQTQALDEAEYGNVAGATQKLRQAVTILLAQGEANLASQMQQEAERLEQGGEFSSEGKKTIKLTARKTVRLGEPGTGDQ
jgi:Ca-activated chloride channel family protein